MGVNKVSKDGVAMQDLKEDSNIVSYKTCMLFNPLYVSTIGQESVVYIPVYYFTSSGF